MCGVRCRVQQAEAALRGVVPAAVNPEKLARATESLAKLRTQLADLDALEATLQPKVITVLGLSCYHYRCSSTFGLWKAARAAPGLQPDDIVGSCVLTACCAQS